MTAETIDNTPEQVRAWTLGYQAGRMSALRPDADLVETLRYYARKTEGGTYSDGMNEAADRLEAVINAY